MNDESARLQRGQGYSRRQVIGQLAWTAAGTALRPLAPLVASGRSAKRVIVVGAGLAGLCAAYELAALGHEVSILEAQERPGGRVQTLRAPFTDGLYAEAGASRIPTSHDLTLGYASRFELPVVPFEPVDVPSIRYAYKHRARVVPGAPFEWPAAVPSVQRRLTPADVRRRYMDPLVAQITNPFASDWVPSSLRQYDSVTRDEYLRRREVSDAVLQQNGRHERMHLTLKREATRPAAANVLQQQARFDAFVQQYNRERPHQALGMKVPAELYARSPRVYRGLDELTYPFHDHTILVTRCGRICFKGRKVNLSHVFAGQSVGVTQVGERIWLVTFMQYDLGYFDDETYRLEPIENPFGPKVLPIRPE